MKLHKKVQSNYEPKLKIDEHSVWKPIDVQKINITVEEENIEIYQYDLEQYIKDEYILLQAVEKDVLAQQLTDTQMALVEIYESLEV